MLNIPHSQIIALLCYHIDRTCRHDLFNGNITSERDYVSNIGTHLRYPLGPFFSMKLATSRTLPQSLETLFGCDSIIIFKKNNVVKIGLFEAKWPRYFTRVNYAWDSLNTSGNSRFSSQITRQRNWANSGAVIWEMFFNESIPGTHHRPFDKFGSSCLLHGYANNYLIAHKTPTTSLWNNNDLISILPYSMNFRRIVYNILRCNFGKPFQTYQNSISIRSNNGESISIPIVESNIDDNISNNKSVINFMEKTGIQNYIVVDINEELW